MTSGPKTKYLIVNADDFGYSYSVNKGIIKAHERGIVTSTSVLVDRIAAHEAKDLVRYENLSVGLHFALEEIEDVQDELNRQVKKFISLLERMPDHIDTHKRHPTHEGIKEVLEIYSREHNVPVRGFGMAKHIGSYGVNSNDTSVEQLKRSIDEATEGYNELMCHVGYVDEYLLENSAYSSPRSDELAAICDPRIKDYLKEKHIELINWRQLSARLL